jgi:RNA-binding protein
VPLQLSSTERRTLKARAHELEPTVLVGNGGLTPAVSAEVERSLRAHELIKVRVLGDSRDTREDILRRICDDLDAAPVQHIGKILVIYRPRPDAPPKLRPYAKKKKNPRMLKRSFQNRS